MKQVRAKPPADSAAARAAPPATSGRRARRTLLTAGAAALVLLAAGASAYLIRDWAGRGGQSDPAAASCPGAEARVQLAVEPPTVDAAPIDPAIAQVIDEARSSVLALRESDAAWGNLGMLFAAHDLKQPAAACFEQAERLNPRDVRWVYYQGTSFCTDEAATARAKLTRALELLGDGPRSALVRLRLGELSLRKGSLEEARAHFDLVLRRDGDNPRAHLNLARVARQQGDPHAALSHLRRCAESPHTRKASHLLSAEVSQRLGDVAAAQQARATAARLPDDAVWPDEWVEQVHRVRTGKKARLTMALRLIQQNRFPEAIALLERMSRQYPDAEADTIWLLLGRAYFKQRDFAKADPALRHAANLNPQSPQPWFFLGTLLLYQDRHRDAESALREAVRLKPDYTDAYQNLGTCLLALSDFTGAAEAFGAAVRSAPTSVDAHIGLGESLARQGRKDEAREQVRRALTLNPADPVAQRLLKWIDEQSPGGR